MKNLSLYLSLVMAYLLDYLKAFSIIDVFSYEIKDNNMSHRFLGSMEWNNLYENI